MNKSFISGVKWMGGGGGGVISFLINDHINISNDYSCINSLKPMSNGFDCVA